MTTLVIIAIVLFVAYIVAASIKLGRFPHSLTETATVFPWPWRASWFIAIWGSVALIAPAAIEYANSNTRFLIYIALVAAIIYGFCAKLNEGIDRKITTFAGYVCIMAVVIYLITCIVHDIEF